MNAGKEQPTNDEEMEKFLANERIQEKEALLRGKHLLLFLSDNPDFWTDQATIGNILRRYDQEVALTMLKSLTVVFQPSIEDENRPTMGEVFNNRQPTEPAAFPG